MTQKTKASMWNEAVDTARSHAWIVSLMLVPVTIGVVMLATNNRHSISRIEQLLSASIQNASVAVVIADSDEKIVYSNEEAHQLFGYTFDEMNGKYARSIIPVDMITTSKNPVVFRSMDCQALTKSGQEIASEVTVRSFNLHDEMYFLAVLNPKK